MGLELHFGIPSIRLMLTSLDIGLSLACTNEIGLMFLSSINFNYFSSVKPSISASISILCIIIRSYKFDISVYFPLFAKCMATVNNHIEIHYHYLCITNIVNYFNLSMVFPNYLFQLDLDLNQIVIWSYLHARHARNSHLL